MTTNCQVIVEAWGPNEGCAEFMGQPDTFPCGETATVQYALTNPHNGSKHILKACAEHAKETEAWLEPGELASKQEIGSGGDAVGALEARLARIEKRITALEEFTGIGEFDAGGSDSLHRRIDNLEDWRREQYR